MGRALEIRKIIKVFLGSPGDLKEEREAATGVVDEENANHAKRSGYEIELVKWEGPEFYSQRRRPQDVINEGLEQCDYFVGMLWKKWGTSPRSKEHSYTSGFEEEYEEATKRHDKTGKPGISLFFKEIGEELPSDTKADLDKVKGFREKVYGTDQFCGEFQDPKDFAREFRTIIANVFENQKQEDEHPKTLELQRTKPGAEKSKDQIDGENPIPFFGLHATSFIENFIQKKEDGENSFSAPEVARFRLLASSVSQNENDNSLLGVHDANLIYRHLGDTNFSSQEIQGLVSTALENIESNTVPLWYWIFQPYYKIKIWLPLLTISGGEKRRRSAFKLLGMLAIAPHDFDSRFISSFFRKWFSEGLSDDLIISALEYLGVVGDEGLQMDWDHFIGSSDINVSRAAVRSLARIKSRINKVDAWRFVAKHETIDIESDLTGQLLSEISSVETEVLRDCLNHSTREFRLAIAKNLLERDALRESDARLICESSEADIRLIGVRALVKLNLGLDNSDVRKILVRPAGWRGIIDHVLSDLDDSYQVKVNPGEKEFMEYKIGMFSGMRYEDLLDIQRNEKLDETEATIALYRNHYSRVKDELKKNLLDGFESFCSGRRVAQENRILRREIPIHIRKELVHSALDAFCSNADKSELNTVRDVLERHDLRFSTDLANFIAKHGEWEDVDRVIKLSGTISDCSSCIDHSLAYQLAAYTLLKLAEKKIADVWRLNLPSQVRIQLVVQMSKSQFAELDEQYVVSMLRWDNDIVRAVVALKAIQCLPRARIREILNNYWDAGYPSYYNTIFWLDLGVSADSDTSLAIARNELNKIT